MKENKREKKKDIDVGRFFELASSDKTNVYK